MLIDEKLTFKDFDMNPKSVSEGRSTQFRSVDLDLVHSQIMEKTNESESNTMN